MFCENKLVNLLNKENACELLALADLHSAKFLKTNALKFIEENANEVTDKFTFILININPIYNNLKVIQTEGWKMLEEGNYGEELLKEIMKAINDAKAN